MTLTASCIKIHLRANCDKEKPSGVIDFNSSTTFRALLKSTPEKVSPTSKASPLIL